MPAESSRGQCLIVGWGTMTGDSLKVLDVSADDKVLFTTYGQLQPPLGIHRLKVNLYSFIYNVIICVINLKHCSYTIVADNILQAALVS